MANTVSYEIMDFDGKAKMVAPRAKSGDVRVNAILFIGKNGLTVRRYIFLEGIKYKAIGSNDQVLQWGQSERMTSQPAYRYLTGVHLNSITYFRLLMFDVTPSFLTSVISFVACINWPKHHLG